MKKSSFAVVCVAVLWWSGWASADPTFRGGAVATAHPLATQAALEMLEKGGTAADAAAAAAFTLAVVGPYHSGLGGGGFALAYDVKRGETKVLDFREVAPKGATRDMFVQDGKVVPGLSTDGALSVAVPGAVQGYVELQKKYGKLPLKTVLGPAIRAARDGFYVSPTYLRIAQGRVDCLRRDPEASRLFLAKQDDGTFGLPKVSALVKQPELAKTLQAIAAGGAGVFYKGRIARAIVQTVQSNGGVLSAEDLTAFKTRWREPLQTTFRGYPVFTMPPPSAGGIAIVQVLGALEVLEPQAPAFRDPEHLHRFAEAVRRSYVDRAKYLGDPDVVEIPMSKLLSRQYIEAMARSIDPKKATPSKSLLDAGAAATQSTLPKPQPPRDGTPEGKNTTHISVVDKAGNAVAMTTTVNYGFGSCLVAKGTGVLLNDEMDDFAAQPMVPNAYGLVTGEANAVAPGKIPLSSMSPTIVFSKDDPKKVMLVVGSPGGSTIPTTVLQVILNVIDQKMDVVRATAQGRVHHQYMPDELWVDQYGLEPATKAALRAKGHVLRELPTWGDAEAVFVDPVTGLKAAGSDPRNEGAPAGQY